LETPVGEVKNGRQIAIDAARGKHRLYLNIDWGRSNVVEFESDGMSVIEFECGNNLRGWKIFLVILYATFLLGKYM
jgi:hypothetical protein